MTLFFISLILIAISMAGMAIGVLLRRPPLAGSCGGRGCELCGGSDCARPARSGETDA